MTESDRELLDLAAKAAGHTLTWDGRFAWRNANTDTPSIWNPLADPGDALVLAVELGLTVVVDYHDAETRALDTEDATAYWVQSHGAKSPLLATMRAIVIAAAEVGRRMK